MKWKLPHIVQSQQLSHAANVNRFEIRIHEHFFDIAGNVGFSSTKKRIIFQSGPIVSLASFDFSL